LGAVCGYYAVAAAHSSRLAVDEVLGACDTFGPILPVLPGGF